MKTAIRTTLLLSALLFAGCATQIQHGLEERDANEIISVLTSRGYKAAKALEKGKRPTWAIEVDDAVATDALRVLAELKLPRPHRTTTKEIASQSALIETPQAERLRQLEAQEGDLEETLETMDGVVSSAVELVVPTAPRPGLPAAPSKASVLLRVQPEARERLEQQRASLQALVAASVDGLEADDVVLVVDTVVSQVSAPAPAAREASHRMLIIFLGGALAVLALGLVALAVRLRRRPAPAATPRTPAHAAPGPRPTVSPAIQRKVA